MPALNFQEQFADAVQRGEKRQTVRPIRKRPIKVGDTLYLKTGQWINKGKCRSLGEATCLAVVPIVIDSDRCMLRVGGRGLPYSARVNFAKHDGFASSDELFEWFGKRYGKRFEGVLIQW